jgi:hypothetical protein
MDGEVSASLPSKISLHTDSTLYVRAMGGDVPFEVALAARLELIKPSMKDFDDCLAANPPPLTPGTNLS